MQRLQTEKLRVTSSFFSVRSAEKAIGQVISQSSEEIRDFLSPASEDKVLVLRGQVKKAPGYLVYADGHTERSTFVCVKLVRGGPGNSQYRILTGFLETPPGYTFGKCRATSKP